MGIVRDSSFYEDIKLLAQCSQIVVDVETNGLNPHKNQICGIGIGEPFYGGRSQYYPFRHHQGENLTQDHLDILIRCLNEVTEYIGYNVKFDLSFLEQEGLILTDKILTDVIVMVRLTEHSEVREMGLTPTGLRRYGQQAVDYDINTKKFLRSNKWHKDFSMAPSDILGEYCKKDVELTARIYQDSLELIKKTNQEEVFALEKALTGVLYNMESKGITVDRKHAVWSKKLVLDRLKEIESQIYLLANMEFNISSSQQIGAMFETMGIYSPVKTAKGADSWNERALVNINNPIAGLIRQYRTLDKLNSTYIEPYIDADIMHTTFCNWGTTTGRLSSRSPNLQNIPRNHFKLGNMELDEKGIEEVRGRIQVMMNAKGNTVTEELTPEVIKTWAFIGDESYDENDESQISIRRLFVPRPEYNLISFDYSQMEVRVFLSYFRNETIDDLLYKDDVDFHGEAAKLAFNVTESDEQFKFYRQMAKGITFGTIYGIGSNALARQLGTTVEEASQYKRRYFNALVGSKDFFQKVVKTVTARGWIKNKYGRRYEIPKNLGYKGVNYLVQGTSADLLSERMIEIGKFLENTRSYMLLQVHDEVILEIHDSELDYLPNKIREMLEQNSLDIPLKVDMEICTPSWANKKDLTPLAYQTSFNL